jgi:hypothetical protein
MGAVAGVFLLGGGVLGVGIFGLMLLLGALEFKVIGGLAIAGLFYGLYSFFRNPI